MIKNLSVRGFRLYPGARAGLDEATALGTLVVDAEPDDGSDLHQAMRDGLAAFAAGDALQAPAPGAWPDVFLTEPSTQGLAAWVVALTVWIQRLACDPVGRGRVIAGEGGQTELALPYVHEKVLRAALAWSMRYLIAWQQPAAQRKAGQDAQFERWLEQTQARGLAPNTLRFALAARQRGIPVQVVGTWIRLGWGASVRHMDSSFTDTTGVFATRLARDKVATLNWLKSAALPVPESSVASTWANAEVLAQKLGWPVVIKPANLDQGIGVVPDIRDTAFLKHAFDAALKLSPAGVVVQKHVAGEDHRMLVVGGKLRVVTRRNPGGVLGDGVCSVEQLIGTVNADPRRGVGKRSMLISLGMDEEALRCLEDQGLTPASVPEAGRFVRLRRTANISSGGTALDVTPLVHADNRALAERVTRTIGLDIAGVDFLCPDISRSWREVGGAVIEVNGQPGFRVHWLGDPGRDINGEVIDWMFHDRPSRIPTAAITGTNGKSTTASMLHHIWMGAGKNAGVCSTHGVWIGHELVSDQNLSGFPGARMLLSDPAVEAAVIEMPRKGLVHFGHPCDRYDVAALLNVQDDHIVVDGINSLEQMARLKAEVLERAREAIVVNAEDPLCLAMRVFASATRHILVARSADASALRSHLAGGGDGVFVQMHDDARWIVLAQGAAQTPLMPLAEVPATMNGRLRFNEINALFAVALAWAQGLPMATVRAALASFGNSPEHSQRGNLATGSGSHDLSVGASG